MHFPSWAKTTNWHCMQTFSGDGGSAKRWAAMRKMSGCGLPCLTSGSSEPQTTWWNKEKSCLWREVLRLSSDRREPVANAIRMLFLCRCFTSRSAPQTVTMYSQSLWSYKCKNRQFSITVQALLVTSTALKFCITPNCSIALCKALCTALVNHKLTKNLYQSKNFSRNFNF